ncbi:MAG: sulfotransferase [Acidobacteriota bacterium]
MSSETAKQKKSKFRLPSSQYYALRLVHRFRPVLQGLGQVESALLRRRTRPIRIDRPIYICGVPRCGTTIMLEMLSRHPSLACHTYVDMLQPYTPYFWNKLASRFASLRDKPTERLHQDRIKVTPFSPESVEELLWLRYFNNLHSTDRSCLLTAEDADPRFDAYYTDHLKKLLLLKARERYLTKANYDTTRLLYLHRLFPDARFLLMIRHPVNHISSLMKQDRLIRQLAEQDSRILRTIRMTGHFDFGESKCWLNLGDGPRVEETCRAYTAGRKARAWAMHWSAMYDLVFEQLQTHTDLARSTLIVPYEELCERSAEMIDAILSHCQLDGEPFAEVGREFAAKLRLPTYYQPHFSDEELADIEEVTAKTCARFKLFQVQTMGAASN